MPLSRSPANPASTAKPPHGLAVAPEWKPFGARLIQESRAAVVPNYSAGQNCRLFQWASLVSMTLRLSLLFREVVNKIQYMRRQADFEITDRIEVFFEGTEVLREAIERHGALIRRETQAVGIEPGRCDAEAREEWKINGEPTVLFLRRV